MSSPEKEDDDEKTASIQVDVYGFKLVGTPAPTPDVIDRITVIGLLDDIWQNLLRTLRDVVGLVADCATGSRSIVRGVAALPSAIATRVRGAHVRAEKRESEAQQCADPLLTREDSINNLASILDAFRSRGLMPKLTQMPDGKIVLRLTGPENEEVAAEAASHALNELPFTNVEAARNLLGRELSDFELSERTLARLHSGAIYSIRDATAYTYNDLKDMGFETENIHELKDLLLAHELVLGMTNQERVEWMANWKREGG